MELSEKNSQKSQIVYFAHKRDWAILPLLNYLQCQCIFSSTVNIRNWLVFLLLLTKDGGFPYLKERKENSHEGYNCWKSQNNENFHLQERGDNCWKYIYVHLLIISQTVNNFLYMANFTLRLDFQQCSDCFWSSK